MVKLIFEFLSAALILMGFELINRKSKKGFYAMAIGQFMATIICLAANLWFLSFMHFVNFIMQFRGWIKWTRETR